MKLILRVAALASLTLVVGCSSGGPHVVPVKGVVTRGGKPVTGITVRFVPSADVHQSSGKTDGVGRFELHFDRTTKGATVGTNKVVAVFLPRTPQEQVDIAEGKVVVFHPEQDAILEKYGKRETTPLTVEITRAEDNLQIKLD
jgi:hypothetical protein